MSVDTALKQDYEYMVCVCSITYNHEKYIRECLEGIVMQQTTFPFISIVVDDASTDQTPSIISEYAAKYPDIIHSILLKENHYSQKKPKEPYFIPFQEKAKYVAFCEGDDYWTDPHKLQKQVDALEKHHDCKACVHKVLRVNERGEQTNKTYPSVSVKRGCIRSSRFIGMLRDDFTFHITSFFFNAKEYVNYITSDLKFVKVARCGDVPLLLYFGQNEVYYIDDPMSCYREGSIGSHTDTMLHNEEYRELFYKSIDEMMDEYDIYTHHRFHKYCQQIKQRYHFIRLQLQHYLGVISIEQYEKEVIKKEYRYSFRKNTPLKARLLIYLNVYLPKAGKFVKQHFVHSK